MLGSDDVQWHGGDGRGQSAERLGVQVHRRDVETLIDQRVDDRSPDAPDSQYQLPFRHDFAHPCLPSGCLVENDTIVLRERLVPGNDHLLTGLQAFEHLEIIRILPS